MTAWTLKHHQWLRQQRFELAALQIVYDEYLATLALFADRVTRLERAIADAIRTLAPAQQALVGFALARGCVTRLTTPAPAARLCA